MFYKILKKDLRRNKSMNIILFVFIMLTSTLIASSANMLYTFSNAVPNFIEKSNIADFISITNVNDDQDRRITEWADANDMIKNYYHSLLPYVDYEEFSFKGKPKRLELGQIYLIDYFEKDYNSFFNQNDKSVTIKEGEIGIPVSFHTATGMKVGDELTIRSDNLVKTFRVSCYIKDAMCGASIMGVKRFVVNKDTFNEFATIKNSKNVNIYSFDLKDSSKIEKFEKEFNQQSYNSQSSFGKSMISKAYLIDLLMAAVLVLISIFLIVIAFLILRFTIVYTLQEDYKQIGIMKAIGLKNRGIKSIYMVKYTFLSLLAGGIGLAVSFPLQTVLSESVAQNIIITKNWFAMLTNIIAAVFVILINVLFCNNCTRKLNKVSAISAISNGSSGERFTKSKKISLHTKKHCRVPLFLAVSDLINGIRKYIILIITFILGTILIILPINIINTLSGEELLDLFNFAKADVFISPDCMEERLATNTEDEFLEYVDSLEKKLEDDGINIVMHPEITYSAQLYLDDPKDNKNVLATKGFGISPDEYSFLKGDAPVLENEIAVTERVADYLGVEIGDRIHMKVNGNEKSCIVTALFQSMNNLGYSCRVSDRTKIGFEGNGGFSILAGFFKDADTNKEENIRKIKSVLKDCTIKNTQEYASSQAGYADRQMKPMRNIIMIIVLGINILITVLVVRLVSCKEIPEIALLKSLGVRNQSIKDWQCIRIAIVIGVSILIGAILSGTTGNLIAGTIFGAMGATSLHLTVKPLEVYLLYPLLIFVITIGVAMLSLGIVKKTKVWEINNQE